MSNLSKKKRQEIHEFLSNLKKDHSDDVAMQNINEIERLINEKKYGLVWEKHTEKVDEMLEENIPVFKEIEDKKIKSIQENKYNFLLEGDNLHSLKLLEKTHKEKIDLSYIDPPYNTGNKDFEYDDKYIDREDGFRHSKWLSFMHERLIIARRLLKDSGFIMISIDDSEYSQLKILCDEVFGEDNYQATIHAQVRYAQKSLTEEKNFKPVMEYVLIYSKKNEFFDPKKEEEEYTDEKFRYKIKELTNGEDFKIGNQEVTVFKKGEWEIEEMEEGRIDGLKETWISGTIYTKMSYGKVFQSVVEPRVKKDGLSCLYKVHGRGNDGLGYRYYTGPKRKNAKRGKMYSGMPLSRVEEITEKGSSKRYRPINTYYDFAADFGNINHEGGVTFNSGKKPTKMLKMLINLCKNKNALILDFFAGSGTTGHAVEKLNEEDGGNRKYILCTNNENNICEKVTYKRLRNIQKKLPHNLKYFKTDFIPKFSEEEVLSTKLVPRIKEMIELENMCEIDGKRNLLILNEDDLENKINEDIVENANIYIPSHILLSREEENIIEKKNINIIDIPDYYFMEELREVGEL